MCRESVSFLRSEVAKNAIKKHAKKKKKIIRKFGAKKVKIETHVAPAEVKKGFDSEKKHKKE